MSTSYGAICTDFYVNQKLSLRLDLPESRETRLGFLDRMRRACPDMERLRRFDDELTLESAERDSSYRWLGLYPTSIRSGSVNPDSLDAAYALPRAVLEIAPYYLSISPLDVDFIEVVFGFDLEAQTNRDQVVFEALLADSALGAVMGGGAVLSASPVLGFALNESCEQQAYVEIKTRTRAAEVATGQFDDEPISIYLTVRHYGILESVESLGRSFDLIVGQAEELVEQRVVPHIVQPIRDAILSRPR